MERVLSREGYIMTLSSTHASVQEGAACWRCWDARRCAASCSRRTPRTRPRAPGCQGTLSCSLTRQTRPRACHPYPSTTARGAALAIEHLRRSGMSASVSSTDPPTCANPAPRGVQDAIEHWQRLTGSTHQLTVYNAQAYTAQAGHAATDAIAEAQAALRRAKPPPRSSARTTYWRWASCRPLRVGGVSIPTTCRSSASTTFPGGPAASAADDDPPANGRAGDRGRRAAAVGPRCPRSTRPSTRCSPSGVHGPPKE